jgi:hypothetical protein
MSPIFVGDQRCQTQVWNYSLSCSGTLKQIHWKQTITSCSVVEKLRKVTFPSHDQVWRWIISLEMLILDTLKWSAMAWWVHPAWTITHRSLTVILTEPWHQRSCENVKNGKLFTMLTAQLMTCTRGVGNILRTSVCTSQTVLEVEVLWSGLEFVMMVALSSKLFKEHWLP